MLARIRVQFIGENGVDAGGLKKDWFTTLVRDLFNPNYALFTPSANGRSHQPNPSSYVNEEHIQYFKFAGAIIARALIEGVYIDAHLTISLLKSILGIRLTLRDLEDIDEALHSSLKWILDNPIEDMGFPMYFTTDYDDMGKHKILDLKPHGSQVEVTDDNKEEYVKLMVEHRLKNQIRAQINAFTEGFFAIVPPEEIRVFTPNELDLLICGIPEINVEDMRANCTYQHPYSANHPVIAMFWKVVSSWKRESLAKLLLFITGSSQVPLRGFAALRETDHPICIASGGNPDRLPAAHTCFNTLDLPEYTTEEELSQKLLYSIMECDSFGFI